MSLPIIRLERTSVNNAELTTDPLRASVTLYSFLRSVPSEAEVAAAMNGFRLALHRRREQDAEAAQLTGTGLAAVPLPPAEERLWQRLESALLTGVLRRAPAVLPEWCRRHSDWRLLFAAAPAGSAAPVLPSLSSSPSPSPSERLVVKTAALRQFMTPYEEYEHRHGGPGTAAPVAPSAPLERSGSTQAPDTPHFSSSSSVSGDGSAPPHPSVLPELGASAAAEGCCYHPLLPLLARQAHAQDPADYEEGEGQEEPSREAAASAAIAAQADRTAAALSAAQEATAAAMDGYEADGGSVWTPAFTYLRNGAGCLTELQGRARAAADLHRVEACERDTIATAQRALLAEVAAIRLLLRDVHRVVADAAAGHRAEERRGAGSETVADDVDRALAEDLAAALSPLYA